MLLSGLLAAEGWLCWDSCPQGLLCPGASRGPSLLCPISLLSSPSSLCQSPSVALLKDVESPKAGTVLLVCPASVFCPSTGLLHQLCPAFPGTLPLARIFGKLKRAGFFQRSCCSLVIAAVPSCSLLLWAMPAVLEQSQCDPGVPGRRGWRTNLSVPRAGHGWEGILGTRFFTCSSLTPGPGGGMGAWPLQLPVGSAGMQILQSPGLDLLLEQRGWEHTGLMKAQGTGQDYPGRQPDPLRGVYTNHS